MEKVTYYLEQTLFCRFPLFSRVRVVNQNVLPDGAQHA
jgi:hypothetical protein